MAKSIRNIIRLLALSFSAAFFIPVASALPTDYYAPSSRLSEGRWVKIKIDTTGVYRIPHTRLRELGFSSPERVFVYGTGAVTASNHTFSQSAPDDLPMTPCLHVGDALVFYGEGDTRIVPTDTELGKNATVTRSYADRESFFFLGESSSAEGYPFLTSGYTPNASDPDALTTSMAVSYIENECTYIGEGGAHMFDHPIPVGQSRPYFLDIKDICFGEDGTVRGFLTYGYVANDYARADVLPEGDWSFSSKTAGTATSPSSNLILSYATGKMIYRGNTDSSWLKVNFQTPSYFSGDYLAPDYLYTVFERENRLGDDSWKVLNMVKVTAGSTFRVSDAPADVEIWNITDVLNAVRLESQRQGEDVYAPVIKTVAEGQAGRYLVFSPSAQLPEPTVVGEIANQNLHADRSAPRMLIVSTASLMDQAEELAEIHRSHDGMDVKVVCQDLIFNEFSSGSRLPQGIRRYIKMLYDSDTAGNFKYVLLYGPALFDSRFVKNAPCDYLPTYENETRSDCLSNTTSYGSDIYYGTLADNYSHTTLYKAPTTVSVGRIPANTEQQASEANAKIRDYLANPLPSSVALRALFLSDCNNEDNHYLHSQSARSIISGRPAPVVSSFVSHLTPKDAKVLPGSTTLGVKRYLEEGTSLVWYAGHGSINSLGSLIFWTVPQVLSTPYNHSPFGFFATCDTYGFDYDRATLVASMVMCRRGGLIGGVSSTRTAYMQYNSSLNDGFARAYAAATPGQSFADVYYTARNTLTRTLEKASCINIMAYNYCGDPSITLPLVSHGIELTDGAGLRLDQSHAAISPSERIMVKARVTSHDSSTLRNTGSGTLQIFAPVRTENYKGAKAQEARDFIYEDEMLAEMPLSFVDGEAEVYLALPDIALEAADYRMVASMRDNQSGAIAAASTSIALLAGSGPEATRQPQILTVYINDPANTDGAAVSGPLTVHAEIEAGDLPMITSPRAWRGRPRCMLDGTSNLSSAVSLTAAGTNRLLLSVPLPECTPGRHCIELAVSDSKGNNASAMMEFSIDESYAEGTLALASDAMVYRSAVEFDTPGVAERTSVESLHLTDASGNPVFHVDNPSFPYSWDLKDYNGTTVDDGEYHAYIRVRRDNTLGSSPKISFMILK